MRILPAAIALLALLPLGARGQQILSLPLGKAPPARIPGGIQVEVHNRTAQPQQLRVRAPGGNWFLLDFPPHGGRNLLCEGCRDHLEAALTEEAASFELSPGQAYEMRQSGDGPVRLQSRGRARPAQGPAAGGR